MRRTIRALWKSGLMVAGLLTLGSSASAQTITVGAGTSVSLTNDTGNPIYRSSAASTFNFSQSVHLYTATDLAALPLGCTITNFGFFKTTTAAMTAGRTGTLNVYMKSSSATALASGTAWSTMTSTATLVYTNSATTLPATTGYWSLPLTTSFPYTGGGIEVYVDWSVNAGAGNPTTGAFQWQYTAVANAQDMGNQNSVALGGANNVFGTQLRRFNAQIVYTPPPPCTSPPTAGTTVASVNPACLGGTTLLSLTGGTLGSGQTYQWLLNGSPVGGATNPTYNAPVTGPGTYRCEVTCSGLTNTSSPLAITLQSAFPEDFSVGTMPPHCWSETDAGGFLNLGAANGLAAAGTGSAQWNFFALASSGATINLTSPAFTTTVTPMLLNFDVAGATYTGGEIDHIIVEVSSNNGSTWPTTIVNMDNNPTNGLLNPTHLATTANYSPTTAGEWSSLSYAIPVGTNMIRFRGVSGTGNFCYVDNVNLVAPPACPIPTSVSVANITGFNADVSWTCALCTGQYYVEFGAPGFTPGTTAAAGAGGTVQGPFGTSPATITVPTALTTYQVYVRQDCGGGSFSANSSAATFTSACGANPSCSYSFHLTDNYGDGWNGALVQVRQNGLTAVTLGSQITTCEATVSTNLCASATIDLVVTAAGSFPDEPGLTMTSPFGSVLYEQRGTTHYDGNCAITYPGGASVDLAVGTLFTTTGNCTPPLCGPPTSVAVSNIVGTSADVSWNCVSCTGQFYVEYGAPGFVPGTTAAAGGGTVQGPFAGSPVTITVPAGLTSYQVYVRQSCGGGLFSTNSNVANFTSGCTGTSCDYSFHLTDNYGDGWNGGLVEVRQNGQLAATLGPQVLDCEAFVTVNLCNSAAITLVCTASGSFPDEPGLTMTNPFGGILYEQRGTTIYDGNCAITYPGGASQNLAVGTLYSTVGNCTPPACIDPPTAGTITVVPATVCSGSTATLTMSNGTATGLLRQWQSSSTGNPGSWSSIGGANNQAYITPALTSSTYYRFYLDCGAGSDTSAAVLVNVSVTACYCTPTNFGCGNGDIVDVELNTLSNTSTCIEPAYASYPPSGSTTTTIQRGVTYPLSVTTDQGCIISVWVDYDHSLTYDADEWAQVTVASAANVASTVGLLIPLDAVLGQTGMRIRSRFTTNLNGATDACSTFGSGETEDYVVNIALEPPCLPATAITLSNVSGSGFDVNWTNATNSCGTTVYTVEYGPAGFTPGSGVSMPAVSAGPVSVSGLAFATAYDVYVTRDCNSCGDGVSPSSFATLVTYPDCDAAQPIACPFGAGGFSANARGAWDLVEPLNNFTTVGKEQLFLLDANVAGNYTMSLTANVGSSVVAVYFKPVGTCDPTGFTWVGTNQFTVQTFTFPIVTPGQYLVLVDPVTSDLLTDNYLVSFVCPPQNTTCDLAIPLTCGQQLVGTTVGVANSLPASACPFDPLAPSTGGSVWYTFNSPTNQRVQFSTCSAQSFDTRISVFQPTGAPDCSNLQCLALNDDQVGCPNLSSQVSINAQAGITYYIAIHGYGADEGVFELLTTCSPECTPIAGNDYCTTAATLPYELADGTETFTTGSNQCATVDFNIDCEPFEPMQGVWYTFQTGDNTLHSLSALINQQPTYTATTLSAALFTGACDGQLGATTQEGACLDPLVGYQPLTLTPNTIYRMLVWNSGGPGFEGSFALQLTHPGMNDAAIDTVLAPDGSLCSTAINPIVRLHNFGEAPLTAVNILYHMDAGADQTFAWTGSLAIGATEDVPLPVINTTQGNHVLHVSTSLPNGVADEIPANDAASKAVNVTGETIVVVIHTDNNPGQISWVIRDEFTNTFPGWSGGPYAGQPNQDVVTNVCLPTQPFNDYGFYLTDSGNDGLCCLAGNGFWRLQSLDGTVLLQDLFKNTPSGGHSPSFSPLSPSYTVGHEFGLPKGPTNILPSECNIFTNVLSDKVYTKAVPGVNTYQFEFTDPDAGFRRRIAVSLRNWVKFSEMQTSPLVPGTVYFARARADQANDGFTNDNWGGGCEMGIDPNQVPGCTGLISDISLPTYSCGATKRFGGSDKIYAVPVLNATQYRFKFQNSELTRTIVKPSYVCLLNWLDLPLVNGSTYNVSVEVFVNGAWGGYCGPVCSLTIQNPAMAVQTNSVAADATGNMVIYPNPTNGRFTLMLEGLSEVDRHITVEMYDLYGKRVMARDIEQSGSVFNEVMNMDGQLSMGVYLVNVTVDGKTYTQRLTVL